MRRHLLSIFTAALLALLLVTVPCALAPSHAQQAQRETPARCISESVSSVAIDTATSGNVQLVALTAGQQIYVCGFVVNGGGTVGVQFVYGTGTACATGETDLTGVFDILDNSVVAVPNAGAVQFATAESNALCLELSGAVQVNGYVTYVKY